MTIIQTIFQSFLDSPLRLKITDFLNITLINNQFIFINLWWFVHLFTAIISTFILLKFKFTKRFIFIFLISSAIIYEIVEWFAYTKWLPILFIPETFLDITWDLIAAIIGISLVMLITRLKQPQ